MPTSSNILAAHTVLHLRSFDRLFLNLYVPTLQRPEQLNWFLRTPQTPIPSPVLFQRRSDAFVRALRTYAAAHDAPWLHFERGESKEERMRPYLQAAERAGRSGLVAVGIGQERTFGWGFTKTPGPHGIDFGFVRRSVYVNHYYLYIFDAQWGPSFIKIAGYAPWTGRVWLNGHEWLKRQLTQRGIAFRPLDNGLLSVERPETAQQLADELGPRQVRAYLDRWLDELPQPLSAADHDRGYRYVASLKQIEIADTRVFDRPLRGRQWFEAAIPEQLTLGRPQEIALLFDRRVTRRTPGRFETHVLADRTTPEILFRYKRSTIKQYLKQGRALRTETTVNDTYDLGIGRALEHLGEVGAAGNAINDRLIATEAGTEDARLAGPELTALVLPARAASGRRIPALRFGDPRVMALLAAVVALANLPAGFQNAQLRRSVAALQSLSLEEYSASRMTYDLGRLVGHELIAREAGTHRYRPTAKGLATAALLTKLADRVLDPAIARIGATAPPAPTDPWRRFESALDALLARANIAA